MKIKLKFLLIISLALGSKAFCQNTIGSAGNVGIGTLDPLTALDVRDGNILVKNLSNVSDESMVMIDHSLKIGAYQNFGTSLRTYTENAGHNIYALQFFTQSSYLTGQTEKLRIKGNGNVGIGVSNPQDKLSVNGNIRWGDDLNYIYSGQDNMGAFFEQVSPAYNQNKIRLQSSKNGDASNYAQLFIDANNGFSFQTTGNANGNVGIGTANPSEKLSVNGKIRAQEIRVELNNWPDYVFEEDYKQDSLQELERYIKANKHLPGMPSAKEVAESGVELGKINSLLLKNIEELTLHVIDKDKKLSEVLLRLEELEKKHITN
ncbi:MAG: hypothetical protein EOO43_04415 [Flavobacterium sp.]|nr:MAG: hypothetical protein EOO43_04415 [Flavobacterium sp.]